MDFGQWEGQPWDRIDRAELDAWVAAFASYRPGGGENLTGMLARVAAALQAHCHTRPEAHHQADHHAGSEPAAQQTQTRDVVWITHAGVIRCVAWLQAQGMQAQGAQALPRSEQWPVHAPAWGEWDIAALGRSLPGPASTTA